MFVIQRSRTTNNNALDWNGYSVYVGGGSMRTKIYGRIEIDDKGRELFCSLVSFMLLIDFTKIHIPITKMYFPFVIVRKI